MFAMRLNRAFGLVRKCVRSISLLLFILGVFIALGSAARAQDQSSSTPSGQQTEPPPAAGGPQTDVGPYAIPKKKDEPPPPPPPSAPKKVEGMPDYAIRVDVPLVNLDVMVTTKDGQTIPHLTKENFRISEDGVQQTINNFGTSDAPITAALLVEFGATNYHFMVDAVNASYVFASTLKKDDWVAVISYDMRPQILADFTQDKKQVYGALNQLRIPGFTETNLFDALYDTLDRVDRIEGHKYIILISTGIDTFSRINLDQIMKKIKITKDVTIFSVSVGWIARTMAEARGHAAYHGMGIPISQIDYLQADNEMQTFAKLTGGKFYQPRFIGDMVDTFKEIGTDIRDQYNISYHPTNTKQDGTYRKLKVEVVAPDGGPLKIRDQKGKDLKYIIIAREGYTAKHTVE
jgi:VWFA-related protein